LETSSSSSSSVATRVDVFQIDHAGNDEGVSDSLVEYLGSQQRFDRDALAAAAAASIRIIIVIVIIIIAAAVDVRRQDRDEVDSSIFVHRHGQHGTAVVVSQSHVPYPTDLHVLVPPFLSPLDVRAHRQNVPRTQLAVVAFAVG